jgi:hypothetical protein
MGVRSGPTGPRVTRCGARIDHNASRAAGYRGRDPACAVYDVIVIGARAGAELRDRFAFDDVLTDADGRVCGVRGRSLPGGAPVLVDGPLRRCVLATDDDPRPDSGPNFRTDPLVPLARVRHAVGGRRRRAADDARHGDQRQ